MLDLDSKDLEILDSIAQEINTDDKDNTFNILAENYKKFGSLELIKERDHEEFFRSTYSRLLENIKYTGKKSEEVFYGMKPYIKGILSRLGVPINDLDDMKSIFEQIKNIVY